MTHKDFQLLSHLSYRKDKVKTMISDKTDSNLDKNAKKAKNKVLGHLLSLFFGILLGGLLCLLLVVIARRAGLISFGEADSFYDTAVSYYSEQFGDAASAQSQKPASFARFYTRAADTSILNSDAALDLERILQENVLLEGEGSEDADTANSDAADSENAVASLVKEITGKKMRLTSKLQETGSLDGISRDFSDLTVNEHSPISIPLDTSTSRLYQRVYLTFTLRSDSDGTLTISQDSDMAYQIPFTAGEKKNVQIFISLSSDSVNFSCEKGNCQITDLALLGSVKTIDAYTGARISFDENTKKDQISGTVTAENAGFLFLPIPYSKNVKAYVDGIKTDVLRADACFVCVPVGSGEHTFAFYRK